MLTLEKAKELLNTTTTEEHLFLHAKNVMAAMEGLAKHFGEDSEHWKAIGYLHDYDYEHHPEEHLKYTEQPLKEAGLEDAEIRAILAHGYGIVNDVEPITNLEKCLYTVDELTGIIQAAARMRPAGITDMQVSSFMKKFKDKKFAAKCDRELIKKGCEMLGMEVKEVAEICIEAMKQYADELQLGVK
ncbi:MAG: HD domain-containing protein [Clostridia bacterium]|nr:HD domain-containing protein [Clostridia bacterium]